MKLKALVDINEFICAGDILIYNEWLEMWGTEFITYKHKMLTNEYVNQNMHIFKEVI